MMPKDFSPCYSLKFCQKFCQWRQKCSLLQVIELLTEKTWGQGCVIFSEQKNKEWNGKTLLRMGKYFEWIIKQLLLLAFIGYEEFCRSWRVLSTPPRSEEFFEISHESWIQIITKYNRNWYQWQQSRSSLSRDYFGIWEEF